MLISDVQQIESLLGMYYQFYVCVCVCINEPLCCTIETNTIF